MPVCYQGEQGELEPSSPIIPPLTYSLPFVLLSCFQPCDQPFPPAVDVGRDWERGFQPTS